MSVSRVFAGIDQGTTGTRTNLYDTKGRFITTSYRRTRTQHPAPGWNEQDAEELVQSIEVTLAEALNHADGAELAGIGLANQGESVVAFDRISGAPLSPVVLWSDRRSTDIIESMAGTSDQRLVEQVTGLPLDPYYSAGKMAWMLRNIDAVSDASKNGTLAVGTLDSYFTFRLSDGKEFATDPSTACRTQLMSLDSLQFEESCAEIFGIDITWLADMRKTVLEEPIKTTCGAPIAASICDQPSALAAIGAVKTGDMKVTHGTGCFIDANAGPEPVRPEHGLMPIFAWALPSGEMSYAVEGGVFSGGTAVDWAVGLGLADTASDLDKLAESGIPRRVFFLPALSGVGAPWWRAGAAGVFAGLRASSQKSDLAFAVLEGIAHRVVDVLDAIGEVQALPTEIRVDGGLSASDVLLQLEADLSGRPILASAEREGTAAGAAGLAAIGLGELDLPGLAARASFSRRFEPRLQEGERIERRQLWKTFVAATRALDPDVMIP